MPVDPQTRTRLLLALVTLFVVSSSAACATGSAASSGQEEASSTQEASAEPESDPGRQQDELVLTPLVPPANASIDNPLYAHAHVVLPRVVFDNPAGLVERQFLEAGADRFLREQWEALVQGEPDAYPSSEEVGLGGTRGLLVEMPPPRRQAHAYFVLIAFAEEGIRYFTLEYSQFRDSGTMVGGWERRDDGYVHANYGAGPEAEREAFVERVRGLLQ
jgi:hypothetical protein